MPAPSQSNVVRHEPVNSSTIGRLVSWMSWRTTAKARERVGLPGYECVLTVEAFQALDLLPRDEFMGPVLARTAAAQAAGPRIRTLSAESRQAKVTILPFCNLRPGESHAWISRDLRPKTTKVDVKPDVLIETPSILVAVEAKLGEGSLQPRQAARQFVLLQREARRAAKLPLWILVTSGESYSSVLEELRRDLPLVQPGVDDAPSLELLKGEVDAALGSLTWAGISQDVSKALENFGGLTSADESVRRIASLLIEAIELHTSARPARRRKKNRSR